jgi:hypothetical protein
MAAETLLALYEAGEFEAVWRRNRSYAKLDDSLRDDVLAVANATMRRVAQNADLLRAPALTRLEGPLCRALRSADQTVADG